MRLVLFVEPEPVEAVLAVLEMVLDIVWLPSRLRHWDSAPEGSVALPATTLRVVYATVWDEAAPRGVSALSRRAALWQRRSASVLRRVRVLRSGLGGACVRGVANDPYTVSRRAPTSMQLKPSTLCPIAPRRIVRAPQPTAPRRLPPTSDTYGHVPAERPAAARRSRSEEA